MLTNPYYKGDVTYKGVTYAGTHTPIVPVEVWYRVQSVLSAHNSAGDRRRRHDPYLKGTVYCGACGSRLMISNARSASGNIYPYFVCAGRHAKRTNCTRPAILVDKVEQLVADHYKTIQIPPNVRHAMLGMLDEEFASLHASSETERHQLTVEKDRIQDQRRASLQAHYAGALPLDLLKEEQDRLARQLDLVTARLDALDSTYEEARTHLQECLALAGDCQTVYACGSPTTRRMANQAFFTRIYLDADDAIRAEPTRSFGLLLDPGTQQQALSWAHPQRQAGKRPTQTLIHHVEGSSKTRGDRGGGASKSQPRLTIAGLPIYLGERKPAVPTCRDEAVAAVEVLVGGGGEPTFSVEMVHAAMVSCGSRWSRETVAKTMLRMTRPARRPPYLQLERAESGLYRVVPAREGVGRS